MSIPLVASSCPWIMVWPNVFSFFSSFKALHQNRTSYKNWQWNLGSLQIQYYVLQHFWWITAQIFGLSIISASLNLLFSPYFLAPWCFDLVQKEEWTIKTLRYSGFTEHVFSILTVFNKVFDFLMNCKKRNCDFQKKRRQKRKTKEIYPKAIKEIGGYSS